MGEIAITPIAGALGAEIAGVDLSRPLDGRTVAAVRQALLDHLVIFFRDQRLTSDSFLAFAQTWKEKLRPEAAKQQMASDPHTPSAFRVIGPLRNVDAWYDAFGIKAGGGKYALAPEARVHIW